MRDFISRASFWVPEWIVPSGWTEHAPFAFWLMEAFRPRVLVELGTHYGYSYMAFMQAVKRLNIRADCFAVDTWEGDEHAGFYGEEVFDRVRQYHDSHYSEFSQLLRTTFDNAVGTFPDGAIDLLHIDGRHFYEDVRHDFETWKPKLSNRAIILFHDTVVQRENFGVFRLWNDLRIQYRNFEFVHGYGLGILGVGDAIPNSICGLFDGSKDEAVTGGVREAYSRLGSALVDKSTLVECTAENVRLHLDQSKAAEDRTIVEGKLSRATAQCEHLEYELTQSTKEREHLDRKLTQSTKEREQLEHELTQSTKEREQLEHELTQSTKEREQLEHELTQSTWEGQRLAADLSRTMSEHNRLLQELAQATEKAERVQAELTHRIEQLDRVILSVSWRLTSPIRKMGEKMPWLKSMVQTVFRPVKYFFNLLGDIRCVRSSGLFDQKWYLKDNPDVAKARKNPLLHYLRHGGFEGRNPHPLFDSAWYFQQYPDVARASVNPLVHYLRVGWVEGRDPSPHFDSDWYLQEYSDVAEAGLNPLIHYARFGFAEGRNGNQELDDRAYLSQHSEVVKGIASPAFQSQRQPATQNGDISARRSRQGEDCAQFVLVNTQVPERPTLQPHPIGCPAQPELSESTEAGRRLICITHVLPYPSRAGNEYRIHRMLDWLSASSFEIFLVVCPLPGCVVTPQELARACSVYANLILCERDGTLLYHLASGDGLVKGLKGIVPRDFGGLLGEKEHGEATSRLLPIVRTFCPDHLAEVLLHFDSVLEPQVVLAEYVFMTRAFPLLRRAALRVVDTHDVFSTKKSKIEKFGIEDSLAMSNDEEASLLASTDLLIAIQSDEAAELAKLVPSKPIVTVGIDFDPIHTAATPAAEPVILMVGSDNPLNVKGLRDFLRFAWPLVCREVPNAELRVVGAVGLHADVPDLSVKIMGPVDDLPASYAGARVVINPAVAGTGLKIKTIEAFCHLRPLVTWPSGVDGVESDMRDLCYVATDWYEFAQHVIDLCRSDEATWTLVRKREEIRKRFSAEVVYGALRAALSVPHAG